MLNNGFESITAAAKFIAREICREKGFNSVSIYYNVISGLYSFEFKKKDSENLYLNIILIENEKNIMLYYVNKVIEEYCFQSLNENETKEVFNDSFNLCRYENVYVSITDDIYTKDLSKYLSTEKSFDNILIRFNDVEGRKELLDIISDYSSFSPEDLKDTEFNLYSEIINRITESCMIMKRYSLKKVSLTESEKEASAKIIIGSEKGYETTYIKIKKNDTNIYCFIPINGHWQTKQVNTIKDIFEQFV